MSESMATLHHQIGSAKELKSVVRTMKSLAASSIGQYEQSVRALADYNRTVELGLGLCFRESVPKILYAGHRPPNPATTLDAVVFGSDQGLVGQFNEVVADFALKTLSTLSGKPRIWAVGERVHSRLAEAGLPMKGLFGVPNSVKAITPLIGQILIASGRHDSTDETAELHLFYNRAATGEAYQPSHQRLLPLDETWCGRLAKLPWPTGKLPEIMGDGAATLRVLIREYLFVSLFRASAESLASENASRLLAMERADKNIDEILTELHDRFHRLRQSGIDEELFDVISGFEALAKKSG